MAHERISERTIDQRLVCRGRLTMALCPGPSSPFHRPFDQAPRNTLPSLHWSPFKALDNRQLTIVATVLCGRVTQSLK